MQQEELIDSIDPKVTVRTLERCTECDRETDHWNEYILPPNDRRIMCWECVQRLEKNFFAKRTFQRSSRTGIIPR